MRSLTSDPENEAFHLDIQDKIAWLTFDIPGEKVDKLSTAVMVSLLETIKEIERRNNIEDSMIDSAKEGIWIAGADINEIFPRKTSLARWVKD